MALVYLSSTFSDLESARNSVYHALRRLGHDVIAMEDYVATDERPSNKCLKDVRSCDIYLGIFAWRYGYVPQEGNGRSITEMEFREAIKNEKPCLLFLLHEEAAWPKKFIDRNTEFIDALRAEMSRDFTVSFFRTEDELAMLASTAVTNLLHSKEAEVHRIMHRGVEFVYVPAGAFSMGTPPSRARELCTRHGSEEFNSETPAHSVFLAGFYISRLPVLNVEYEAFIQETGRNVPYLGDEMSSTYNWDPKTRKYPEGKAYHPVVLVSWYDACEYCEWLGGRLPTEAEWEKAARGTSGLEWPWGNIWKEAACNSAETGLRDTTPAGKFSPTGDSPYGIADMVGNVWEWCSTAFQGYLYCATDGREDPSVQCDRVIRGGAIGIDKTKARCAYRRGANPTHRGFTIGFRAALSPHRNGRK